MIVVKRTVAYALYGLSFLSAGYWAGRTLAHAKQPILEATMQIGRFQMISNGEALDTKTGKVCSIVEIHVPEGYKLDMNSQSTPCSVLASQ